MARPFNPPAVGVTTLGELTDVNTAGGDGVRHRAVLEVAADGSTWQPSLGTAIGGPRAAGPARDTFTNFLGFTADGVNRGHAEQDGAVWTIIPGGFVSRVDVAPGGLAETNGATVASPTDSAAWATTTDGLYCLGIDTANGHTFSRVDGVDTVIALDNNAGAFTRNLGQTRIAGIGQDVYLLQNNTGSRFWRYEPWANSWTQAAEPPFVPGAGEAPMMVHDGKLYVLAVSGDLDAVWSYDPLTDVWTQLADSPAPNVGNLYQSVGISIGGLLYVFVQENDGPRLWYFRPDLDLWEQAAATGAPTYAVQYTYTIAYIGSRVLLRTSDVVTIYG